MCIFSKLCESTSITGAVCGAVKEQALDLVAPDSPGGLHLNWTQISSSQIALHNWGETKWFESRSKTSDTMSAEWIGRRGNTIPDTQTLNSSYKMTWIETELHFSATVSCQKWCICSHSSNFVCSSFYQTASH